MRTCARVCARVHRPSIRPSKLTVYPVIVAGGCSVQFQLALDRAEGVISEAARMLTLKRTTLIEKMRKYGVDRLAA